MGKNTKEAPAITDDIAKLLLRLLVGFTMIFHGVAKVTNPGAVEYITNALVERGLPGFLAWGVFVGELVAPAFIIIGLFSRIGAMLVAITMVFAIYLAHPTEIFALNENGAWAIELQMFFLVVSIAIALLGPGRLAIFHGESLADLASQTP